MRKRWAWGMAASLILALQAGPARADDEEADRADSGPAARPSTFRWSPVMKKIFRMDESRPVEPKPVPKAEKVTAKKPASAPRSPALERALAERKQDEVALMRRLDACDKLKEIAIRTNDTELLHRAEKLDEEAWATYSLRNTAPRREAGKFESDEDAVDRQVSDGAGGRSRPSRSRGATDSTSRAAAKEVNP